VGNAAGISAIVSAGNVSWYSVPTGGVPLATNVLNGSTYTTPVINTTTTFYAEAVNNGCVSAARTAVTPLLFQRPANPVAVDGSRCGPGTVSISVTSEPGTVQWFTASTGGTLLQASGNTYVTSSISANTTYYADVTVGGCVSLARTPVVAVIKSFPTVTSTTPASRCGNGTVTLTATLNNEGGINWFDAATAGTLVGTGNFTTPSLTTTTTYYAEAVANGCSSTSRSAVVATIKPIPTIASADVSRCDAGTVTFEATSPGTISWFVAASGGSSIASGQNYTTPSLTNTTPYFIEAVLNGCTTPTRTQVNAIVNTTPGQPTIVQNNSNIASPVLTSSSSLGNQWFRNDVLINGANSNTYTIAAGGIYKVQVTSNGCVSPFSANVVYVVTGDIHPQSTSIGIYPNPVQEELTIDLSWFEKNEAVFISIVDLQGHSITQLTSEGGSQVKMDVRPFAIGKYIIQLKQGKNSLTKSFLKSSN
jgi:hypothetical protein